MRSAAVLVSMPSDRERMLRRATLIAALAVLTLAVSSCRQDGSGDPGGTPAAAPAHDSRVTHAGLDGSARVVIDSARPIEESLRRFRDGLPTVTELTKAEQSRDAVVRRFVRAVERSDTTDLRAMVMSRAEFAYLYYPSSPHTRPPTQQAADLVWFLHLENSTKGVTRVLARYGGKPLHVRGYTCAAEPRTEAENTVWDDCLLQVGEGRDTTSLRLFGGVIARGGRYKLFSYANDL